MGFESMIYLKAGDSQISNAGPSEVPSRLLKEHAEGNIVLSSVTRHCDARSTHQHLGHLLPLRSRWVFP